MNAKELFKRVGKEEVVFETVSRWFCGKCGVIHKEQTAAEQCCKPVLCKCGVEVEEKYWLVCKTCRSEQEKKKEQERFDRAEKLTDWDGPVYSDDLDEFYQDLEAFYDDLSNSDCDLDQVKYVFPCDKVPVVLLDSARILENSLEEAYEGFELSDLSGLDELEAAIDLFNERNENTVNWEPNYKKVVLLDQEVLDEIKKDWVGNEELTIQP